MHYQRRQEIEAKLPKASEPCIRHVSELCLRAGLTGVTQESYLFLHRAFIDYLLTNPEAKMTMLKILNADITRATYEKQYYPDGYYGMPEHALDHTQLLEFKGWVYKGRSGPHQKISVKESPDLTECESCHGKFPNKECATATKIHSHGREHLETLCNYCRMNSEDHRVRADSSGKVCTECTYTSCAYHPKKLNARMIPPAEANRVVSQAMSGSHIRHLEYQPPPLENEQPPQDMNRFSLI